MIHVAITRYLPVMSNNHNFTELNSLAKECAHLFQGLTDNPDAFADHFVRLVITTGSCRGFAWTGDGRSMPLSCRLLDSIIRYEIFTHPENRLDLERGFEMIAPLSENLLELSHLPHWLHLALEPEINNRLLYYQYRIFESPVYHLIAAPLHLGNCAKVRQLIKGEVPQTEIDQRLSAFNTSTVRTACEFRQEDVRSYLSDYAEGEFNRMILTLIKSFSKQIVAPGTSNDYRFLSRETLWQDWCSAFYAIPDRYEFEEKGRNGKTRDGRAYWDQYPEPELVSRFHPSRSQYDRACHEEFLVDQKEVFGIETSKVSRKKKINSKQKKVDRTNRKKHKRWINFDSGHAVLTAHPSTNMPGVLPRVVLAYLFHKLAEDYLNDPVNNWRPLAFFLFLFHYGTTAKWLLSLHVGTEPISFRDCLFPTYLPDSGSICFVPDLYVGQPDNFNPSKKSDEQLNEIMHEHDQLYEPISQIYEIVLPPDLNRLFQIGLDYRNQAVQRLLPLDAALRGYQVDFGAFWFGMEGKEQTLFSGESVTHVLADMTSYVRKFIPNLPAFTPARFRQSFLGYYSTYGLRPEFLHYISGRAFYYSEIPLRYSRINISDIAQAHAESHQKITALIHQEQTQLGLKPMKLEPFKSSLVTAHRLPARNCGSWRTIREDLLQRIFQKVNLSLAFPSGVYTAFLPDDQARYNCICRWALFALGILNGLRPFELPRLFWRNIDFDGGWLSVHGKSRGDGPAYRLLPVLPELLQTLHFLGQAIQKDEETPLFGFYKTENNWTPNTTKDVSDMMRELKDGLDLPAAPAFYSLRHAFRGYLLQARLSFDDINYLMGHQSQGAQSVNLYREFCISDLRAVYLPAAKEIAHRFGVFERICDYVS